MNVIPVNLATEDELSETTLRRLLLHAGRGYAIGTAHGRRGFGYFRNTIKGWNWLSEPLHSNLLLRIAVREVESWLLADRSNLAEYLRTPIKHMPLQPDLVSDPKAALIDAAHHSRSKDIRERIVPKPGSTARQGREYNACLAEFVLGGWSIPNAAAHSPSLQRTVARLHSFTRRLSS